jgi:4-amino-4-deoxy-L-arabinose transferase-like glycosyltransferase
LPAPTATAQPASSAPASIAISLPRERQLLVALTVIALALRVTNLSRSLFVDEAYSLALAQRSFDHMLALFGYEANGTLYPIVLSPLVRIFGTGAALLRAPAVLAGTLSIPALWWAARKFVSGPAALLAAALLALNPMAIWYSEMARQYAFVVLASCLAFGALPRALERNAGQAGGVGPAGGGGARGDAARGRSGRRAWVGYVAAMAALAYCDLLAAPIALPAQALIACRYGRAGVRSWLKSLLALLICCIPLLVAAVIARTHRNALYWLPKTDRGLVELALKEFTGGFSELGSVRSATLLAGAVLVGAALWSMRRRKGTAGGENAGGGGNAGGHEDAGERKDAAERHTLAMAACWGIAPGAILLAISFVEPVFYPRYAILALPGLCLLLAAAAAQLWRSPRGIVLAGACIAVVAGAAIVADAKQRTYLQENWPPVVAWLRAERSAAQPVIVDNALVLPALGYYDPALRAANGDLIVQEWHDQPLPAGFVGYKDRTGYGTVPDGPPSAATFAALAQRGNGTVWMVVSQVDDALQSNPEQGAAVAWARSHCHVQVRESVGVWVLRASSCRQ